MNEPSASSDRPTTDDSSSAWIAPIVGSVLILLAAAASVQAWIDVAPGKVWLTGLAAAALLAGIVAWVFRRGLVFWIGLLTAGGLIVAPAYLYGVDGAALAIAGIPFRLFLPGLFLVALALAGWELARLPKLPLWARFIAPALAVFAAVPVVMGLVEGVPFVEVLVGLWTLPYWSQGAWFGAVVLLPVALLISVLRAVVPSWRSEPFRKTVAIGSIAALLIVSLASSFAMNDRGLLNAMAFVPAPGRQLQVPSVDVDEPVVAAVTDVSEAPEPEPEPETDTQVPQAAVDYGNSDLAQALAVPPEEAAEIERDLNQIFDVMEEVIETIPRDTFDVQAVVDQVGSDPDKLLAWVSDNTAWLPYRGALRGPKGVLLDRAGNSLDRALLLAALLDAAGHKTRLKRAELPPAVAEELVSAAREAPSNTLAVDESYDLLTVMLERLESAGSPHVDEFRQSAEVFRRDRQELIENARDRADRQSKRLLSMINVPDNQEPALQAQAVDAATDHWWTEARVDSKWMALDPMASEANPAPGKEGKSRGTFQADRLPSNAVHTVTIRIVVEQLSGTRLKERVALEHAITPYSEPVVQLLLAHVPEDWPEELTPLAMFEQPDPLKTFVTTAQEQTKWLPVLRVGKDQLVDQGFTDKGVLYTPGGGPAGGGQAKAIGGLAGGLSGGGGDAEGLLTAEWIEFEVRSPGEPKDKIRRAVFDLIGPAARANRQLFDELPVGAEQERALAIFGSVEIMIQGSHVDDAYIDHWSISSLVAGRDILIGSFARPTELLQGKKSNKELSVAPISGPTAELALARGTTSKVKDFFDRPNIVAYWKVPKFESNRQPVIVQGFDIVSNPVGLSAGLPQDFAGRVQGGVMDTVLEGALLTDMVSVVNTSRSFENTPNKRWQKINLDNKEVLPADIPPDVQEQMQTSLKKGFQLIVPKSPSSDALVWWRVDLNSGNTVGVGPRDWGAASVEYNLSNLVWEMGAQGFCIFSSVAALHNQGEELSGTDLALGLGGTIVCIAGGVGGIIETATSATTFMKINAALGMVIGAAGTKW